MQPTIITDRQAEAKSQFKALFAQYETQLNGQRGTPWHQFQQKAIARLDELSFPTRRDESWKYTSVNKILQLEYAEGTHPALSLADIQPFLVEGLDCHRLVFVNGILQEGLSDLGSLPDGLTVLDLAAALADQRYAALVEAQLGHILAYQGTPFRALNAAFSRHGLLIHAARNTVAKKPLYLLHLAAPGSAPIFSNHLNIVAAETNSELSLIEALFELPGSQNAYFNNLANRFAVGENAHVHHYRIQQEGLQGALISNIDASQQRDSSFSSHTVDLGGSLVRNNLNTVLEGPGTSTNYWGTYFAKGEQHIDNQTFIDHAVPHCVSNELYKGILTDKASGVFNGKVMVRKDAQKTNAFQQNASLVLSDKASMDTKPELEIFADDVRCSHGATIGQLDEGAVFYLRSRGLPDSQARALLQHAFLAEVTENIPLEPLRDFAEQLIHHKFES
jgi:Fe-S cluster assembly protein SufD